MGASLCMDLKAQHLCREVRGVARRTQTVLDAFFAHAVDLATNDLQTGILGADIVILATPVRTIVATIEEIGPRLWPGSLVMDMGSTKADICAALDGCRPASSPSAGTPCAARRPPASKPPSAVSIATPPGCSRPCRAPPPKHWTWPPSWRPPSAPGRSCSSPAPRPSGGQHQPSALPAGQRAHRCRRAGRRMTTRSSGIWLPADFAIQAAWLPATPRCSWIS